MAYKDHANNFPFYNVVHEAFLLSKKGWKVFQKFTCEKCGQRLTMDIPNKFWKEGTCDQCGHLTNIEKNGCNYMLLGGGTPEGNDLIDELLESIKSGDDK